MQNTACRPKITVSAGGTGIVSHAGAVLLTQALRVTGLDAGLAGALRRWKTPRAVHDPGKIIADLAVTLALGGDCLADIAALRAEPALFGPVASDPVVSRLVSLLAADAPRALTAIRAARAAARERAWALAGDAAPGSDGGLVTVDIDATIVTSCSEKDQAAPTWMKTFGFHPLTVFADHGAGGSGEPLAILLRPGNAGSNTAAGVGADQHPAAPAGRQLRQGQARRLDVVGGGVRPGVAGAQQDGQRLAGSAGAVVGEHRLRVEPERLLPRGRGLVLLRARGHDRRVDIDGDQAATCSRRGVPAQRPGPLPGRSARGPDRGQRPRRVRRQQADQARYHRVGGHRPEQGRLGAQRRDVGQAIPAQRQSHRQVSDDLPRVVHRPRRLPPSQRGGQAGVQPGDPQHPG